MSEWISVKEQLPEVIQYWQDEQACRRVLMTDGNNAYSGYYFEDGSFVDDCNESLTKVITHWQPLPEPPHEQ